MILKLSSRNSNEQGVRKQGILFGIVALSLVFSCSASNNKERNYTKSLSNTKLNEKQSARFKQLYSGEVSMMSHMRDSKAKYFEIEWSDNSKHISLRIIQWLRKDGAINAQVNSSSVGEVFDSFKYSEEIVSFIDLFRAVNELPKGAILFYGSDDVGPIYDAITPKEVLKIDQVMKELRGKYICFPGG